MTAYLTRLLSTASRPVGIQPRPRSRFEPESEPFPGGGPTPSVGTFDEIPGDPPSAGRDRTHPAGAPLNHPNAAPNTADAVGITTSHEAETRRPSARFTVTTPDSPTVAPHSPTAARRGPRVVAGTELAHGSRPDAASGVGATSRPPREAALGSPPHDDLLGERVERAHPKPPYTAAPPDEDELSRPALPPIRAADHVDAVSLDSPSREAFAADLPDFHDKPLLGSPAGIRHAVASAVAEPVRAEPTEIVVHIGRLDVRSSAPSTTPTAAEPRRSRATPTSLDSYLRARSRSRQ
jgi:hypothetical protein